MYLILYANVKRYFRLRCGNVKNVGMDLEICGFDIRGILLRRQGRVINWRLKI